MANDASVIWARAVRREHRLATLLLGLLVGVAGAIPMIGWEVARRTDAALPTFIEASGGSDAWVGACPAGYVPPEGVSDDEFYEVCIRNQSLDFAPALATLPEVDNVVPSSFIVGQIDLGGGQTEVVGFDVGRDPQRPVPSAGGTLILGRALDQAATGEVVLDEYAWQTRPPGIEIGSTLNFTPFLANQGECAAGAPCEPGGDPTTLTIVGVQRMPSDLASNTDDDGALYLSAGFWATQDDPDIFNYGVGYDVWLRDGAGVTDLERSIATAFPDRMVVVDDVTDSRVATLLDAIDYQVWAARVFAAISALAALVFAGQALARQTRRESTDAWLLTSLGMTRRELALAGVLRAAPVAFFGAVLAAAFAALASPVGPVGIARGTILGATFDLDPMVLVAGSVAVFGCALACSTIPVLRSGHRRTVRGGARRVRLGGTRLPAPVLTGLRAALPRHGDATLPVVLGVGGTAIAVAVVVAAATLVASLEEVTSDPAHYGVAWDAIVGNNSSPEDEEASFQALLDVEGVEAASGVLTTDVAIGDVEAPLMALVPVPGFDPIEPIVVGGRAPFRPNEAALGAVTMRELGVEVGDVVQFEVNEYPGSPTEVEIVGTVELNDGFDVELGDGILVDGTWARSRTPGAVAQSVAVRLDPALEAEALASLEERFGQFVVTPTPSSSVRHLVRVDDLPMLLASVVVALALASMAHLMWVSVRQRRFEFGVLRTIGFRRRQVWLSISVQAASVAAIGVAIGVPAGIIGGRWGWRAIASAIGVSAGPTFVPASIVACVVGAVAVAFGAAAIPGWKAVRTRPGVALRTE